MTFKKLQEISRPHFYALYIDKYFPRALRGFLRYISAIAAVASFILSFDALPLYLGKADGLFFLFTFIYLCMFFVEVFYRSMKNEGLPVRIKESLSGESANIDYCLSSILLATDDIDISRALFETKIGRNILERSGLDPEDYKSFVDTNRTPTMSSSLNLSGDSISLCEYLGAMYDADKYLESLLSRYSVSKQEFLGAAGWVGEMERKKIRKERFWSRENLGALPSIGTSWSYGVSAEIGRFGISFENTEKVSLLDIENGYRDREVTLLENILERREEANAIIIDDDEKVGRDILGRLVRKIKLGVALPSIEHKVVIRLDWQSLIASFKNKGEFESELLKILNQAVSAGNIILYINDLSGFGTSVKNMGVGLGSLISSYLSSPNLQVVASVTNSDFHFFIETDSALLEKFERIIPDKAGVEASIPPLLEQALYIEKQYKFIFSYPSILAIANSADRFISYGEMPGKALDMLSEIAPWANERGLSVLKEEDVSAFVSQKTGVATGEIKEKEAEKIAHLSELIHKRVVGQNEAVENIVMAMRRARSGVSNPSRPIASFLFLGSTGVGKTEVAKALAESFFGDEKKMIRFDMSEYNGPEALSRLIGDFALNKTGLLASKVRDNPYSLLLLDEFEKAAPDVLDLFLQILDEGVFTDALGRQVGCKNLIIIATSNAGSSIIWEIIKNKKDLQKEKDNIINEIIKSKIFRPELLNRFDGVVLFRPLQNEEIRKIALLGLQRLAKRLKEQNIEFSANNDVVNFLVEKGGDPEFGGRSINRFIQEKIEDLVARKIVSGEAKPGTKIEIKRGELE
jgi:ATP-dependent Clp protease ATP-binding subunit ClpC